MATSSSNPMRIVIALVVVALAVIGVVYYVQNTGRGGQVVLGATLPLTGEYSQYGIVPRNAIDLAVEQTEAAGYPYDIEVQYEDTQLSPDLARTAIRKLIDVNHVPVIFGAAGSNETEAIGPIAQENGVVLISASSTAASLSNIGDYFFRTIPTDLYEGAFMARFIYARGVRRIGVFAVNDTGTKSLADAFRDEFQRLGGAVTAYVLAPKDASDLRTQITSLRASSPEAVYFVGYATETGTFLRQQRDLRLNLPLYSAHPAEAPEVLQIAGAAANGLIFSTPAHAADTAARRRFAEAYQARYSEAPGEFAPEAYDAAMLVLQAIREAGTEPAAIRDWLHRVQRYQGVSGEITFSASGDVEKPVSLMTITNGQFVPYQPTQ